MRQFEGHMLLGKDTLGADDALGHGRLGDKESARDLLSGQASEQAKRKSNLRFGGKNGMAGDEHQAEKVVANVIVHGGLKVRHGHLLGFKVAAELFVFTLKQLVTAEEVDGAMFGRGHEP